jgi:PAS domain S-box-containing protein
MSEVESLQAELRELRARTREIETKLIEQGAVSLDAELFTEIWRQFVQTMETFVVLHGLDGRFLFINKTIDAYTPQEILQKNAFDMMPPEQAAAMRALFERISREHQPLPFIGQDSQTGRWFANHFTPIEFAGRVVAVGSVTEDVTEKLATQNLLTESEARLRFLVSSLPIVYWAVDANLCFVQSLGAGLSSLQLQQQQVVGQSLEHYLGSDSADSQKSIAAHRRALLGETVQYEHEFGARHFLSFVSPMRNDRGQIIGVVGVAVDLTEQKQQATRLQTTRNELEAKVQERTNQLQSAYASVSQQHLVLQRLVELLERDKRMMAYEIHDGLVQDLTAAQFFFGAVESVLETLDSHPAQSFQQGMQTLQKTIREARRIMSGCSPYELEQFGLIPAIEALTLEIQERTGIQIRFQHHVNQHRFAPKIDLAVFRIVQESLNNIWKHSGTVRAEVTMEQVENELFIRIRDWGKGFDPNAIRPKNYGVLSIRERAKLLGGEARIESKPLQGTTISVRLPTHDLLLQSEPVET